jgi:hypothetical protein
VKNIWNGIISLSFFVYFIFPVYCFLVSTYGVWGHMVARWLRHCATNRKVAGSIPNGVVGTFRLHNPSGRTTFLVSTQPRTEMSTRNISWG